MQQSTASAPPLWISATSQFNFGYMPTLLPRRFTVMASIIHIALLRPSLYRHEVGNPIKVKRLQTVQPLKRPISLSFKNSRPMITQTPILPATKTNGQVLGQHFNPPAKSLLLRTSHPFDSLKLIRQGLK